MASGLLRLHCPGNALPQQRERVVLLHRSLVATAKPATPPVITTSGRCSSSFFAGEPDLEGVLIQADALHTQNFFRQFQE